MKMGSKEKTEFFAIDFRPRRIFTELEVKFSTRRGETYPWVSHPIWSSRQANQDIQLVRSFNKLGVLFDSFDLFRSLQIRSFV